MKKEEVTKRISSPKIGSIVSLAGTNKDVYIENGQYLVNNRISNFWYWREVLKDGSLGELEHGYGNFSVSKNDYNIQIIVTKK